MVASPSSAEAFVTKDKVRPVPFTCYGIYPAAPWLLAVSPGSFKQALTIELWISLHMNPISWVFPSMAIKACYPPFLTYLPLVRNGGIEPHGHLPTSFCQRLIRPPSGTSRFVWRKTGESNPGYAHHVLHVFKTCSSSIRTSSVHSYFFK